MLYGVKFIREIKKSLKKIDVNKIKNVDILIHQQNIVINNKKKLLKILFIVKLNCIISDIKIKSKIDHFYKKDIGSIKTILKTILANQTDSHQTLMNFLN